MAQDTAMDVEEELGVEVGLEEEVDLEGEVVLVGHLELGHHPDLEELPVGELFLDAHLYSLDYEEWQLLVWNCFFRGIPTIELSPMFIFSKGRIIISTYWLFWHQNIISGTKPVSLYFLSYKW